MKQILLVTSSALGEHSASRRIALELIAAIQEQNKTIQLVARDVRSIAHIDLDGLKALRTEPKDRTPDQVAAVQYSDALIEEVEQASVIVITAPMYAYTIPSTLKAWIEHLNRPGRAFISTDNGLEGLLTGKKVYVVVTRGSCFKPGDSLNFQDTYLKAVLGTFGMKDITFIVAEGTAHESGKAEIEKAEKRAAQLGAELVNEL